MAALFKQESKQDEEKNPERNGGPDEAAGPDKREPGAETGPKPVRPGSQGRGSPASRTGAPPKASPGPAGVSVVAAGTEITGEVTTRGDLRIEGRVEGDVHTRGEVVVSDGGSVKGDVDADVVVVEGRIDGTVTARQVARFRRGCHVSADIESPAVQLDEGAGFNGRIDMKGSSETKGGPAKDAGRPPAGS